MSADAALLFFGLAWWALGRGNSAPSRPPPAGPDPFPPVPSGGQVTSSPPPAPPPWPQTVPAGLPSFPGKGWEFAEPPSLAVQQRARQILQSLWNQGNGAWKAEQTAGQWIVYRAEIVASGKKGVVAYRPKMAYLPEPQAARPALSARRAAPAAVPRATSSPAALPTAAAARPVAAPSSAPLPEVSKLPLLRRGAGMKPQQPSADVKALQRLLGFPTQDGQFGGDTEAALKLYQRQNGLKDDGVAGPPTWASLYRGRA